VSALQSFIAATISHTKHRTRNSSAGITASRLLGVLRCEMADDIVPCAVSPA